MHNIALTWQQAAVLAGALAVVGAALRMARPSRVRRLAPFAVEACFIAALYSVWQLAGQLSTTSSSGAFDRASWIEDVERSWSLPSERSVQRLVVGHPLVVQGANIYYATMHFGVLFAFLIWLFVRHRDRYSSVRTTLALTTLACLLIQFVPVAPPRLLPGFVDTADQYSQSVYGSVLAVDQFSAMPSVHVAWAVLVGWFVIRISESPWRWLAVAHPVLTTFVVVATANHFWLDGIVAVAVLAACAALQRVTAAAARTVRGRGIDSVLLVPESAAPISQ